MNPKFEVKFETDYWQDEYESQHFRLVDVVPKSLSLSCPHCQAYSVMRVDSMVKRFESDEFYGVSFRDSGNLPFDFICSCPNCDGIIFIQAQANINVIRPETAYQSSEELEESSGGGTVN